MARKGDQETLPGVPGPAKRKIIDAIEDLCLERDKLCGKRSKVAQEIADKNSEIQKKLAEHRLSLYTYMDANDVLQDVELEEVLKKRKSKLNPKKAKAEDNAS